MPAKHQTLDHKLTQSKRIKASQIGGMSVSNSEQFSGPAQILPVYAGETFIVVDGANLGDPVSFAEELVLDDAYALSRNAELVELGVVIGPSQGLSIAPDSMIGHSGASLFLDCSLSLMSTDGQTHEAIVLIETDDNGDVASTYLLPLTPLAHKTKYTLVGVDRDRAKDRFAQVACVSFSRGTLITLASGAQVPIETLEAGQKVLTRDDGPQEIRWIGQTTTRAQGAFAPICISAGTLNNDHDLVVSPNHRLFIYQRSDQLGAGRSELLIQARHLVNDDTVQVCEGGFVDYFQLLFDRHQIIYAEGIAAESMLVDQRTRTALPENIKTELENAPSGHARRPHAGLDVEKALLDRPNAAEVLRQASRR
jgi:hypothetical protein